MASSEVPDLEALLAHAGADPLDYSSYATVVRTEWAALCGSPAASVEANLQRFLETHPSLVPGSRSVDGSSGHPVWPLALVSQPPLPGVSGKIPDFLWIATNSASTYPVLIEIERPDKRWFRTSDGAQHSELTHAREQLTEWMAWFAEPANQSWFMDAYRIPRDLRDRRLEPRYVLVHGSRSEFQDNPALVRKRAHLARDNERLLTFDRLEPESYASDYVVTRLTESGFEVIAVPVTFSVSETYYEDYRELRGLRRCIEQHPQMLPMRRRRILDSLARMDRELSDRYPPFRSIKQY